MASIKITCLLSESWKFKFDYIFVFYSGNENRLYEFKEDTVANQFTAPSPVSPNYTTITDIDGNTVNFVGMEKNETPLKTTLKTFIF